VIQVGINLACIPIALKKPAKNTDSTHPQYLAAETSLGCTPTFANPCMTALPLRFKLKEEIEQD
jgi:hypothetical protein